MSFAMIQAFKVTKLKPTERLVAFMLADHLNEQTGRCHPSVRLLAEETGLSVRSVITAIQKLADTGYITKLETDKNGQNRHYLLHPEKGAEPVKEVHRCRTFTGEGAACGPVKEVHRGGEGASPQPVKELHLNHKKPEENHKENHKVEDFSLTADDAAEGKKKAKPSGLAEVLQYATAEQIPTTHAEIFWDMMEAGGWLRGKVKVKDWKAHFRTYHKLGYLRPKDAPQQNGHGAKSFAQQEREERAKANMGTRRVDVTNWD